MPFQWLWNEWTKLKRTLDKKVTELEQVYRIGKDVKISEELDRTRALVKSYLHGRSKEQSSELEGPSQRGRELELECEDALSVHTHSTGFSGATSALDVIQTNHFKQALM